MKSFLCASIWCLVVISAAYAQQGVLKEGYHVPGGGVYAHPQNQQTVTGTISNSNTINVKETKDGVSIQQNQIYTKTTDANKYAKIKKDLQFEAQNLKSKYDTCIYRKEKNCQQYYQRMIQVQDQLTAIEVIEKE